MVTLFEILVAIHNKAEQEQIFHVFVLFFSNRNLRNLLLEGNTIESLPLELGEYALESNMDPSLYSTPVTVDLNIGVN